MSRRSATAVATIAIAVAIVAAGASPLGAQVTIRKDPVEPTPLRAPLRLCAGGDMTLGTDLIPGWGRSTADSLRTYFGVSDHPDSLVAPLRPFFAGADVLLLNVEGAIGRGRAPQKCGPRSTSCFAFRQPPSAAAALRSLGDSGAIVVGNVANNHSRDAGPEGLAQTAGHLTNAGVLVTGADTLATVAVTPAGDTIAFLGFHTSPEAPDARDLAAVRRHVTRAVRDHGTVFVAVHIGAEGATAQRTRNATERFLGTSRGNPVAFARTAFAAGATAVFGHGPHVMRAAEWRGDQLVFYSLGNLLTYGPFRNREPQDRGAVACVVVEAPRKITAAELRPTRQLMAGALTGDSTGRALTLVDSLSALDFPRTGVTVAPDGTIGRRDAAVIRANPPRRR